MNQFNNKKGIETNVPLFLYFTDHNYRKGYILEL